MARHALPCGVWGSISTRQLPSGAYQASVNYRRIDGGYGRAKRSAPTPAGAIRALQTELPSIVSARTAIPGEVTREGKFARLCDIAIEETEAAEHLAFSYRHELVRIINRDLKPAFGALPIREISPHRIHSHYARILKETPGKARMWRVAASRVFDLAVRFDLAETNLVQKATRAPRKPRREIHAPDVAELHELREGSFRRGRERIAKRCRWADHSSWPP